jgi:hypothetical protein
VVRPEDSFNFAYVLPQHLGQPIRIVVPSALQMGWAESPSYFCEATECAQDLTQHLIDNKTDLPYHPVEELMTIHMIPPRARADSPPSSYRYTLTTFATQPPNQQRDYT